MNNNPFVILAKEIQKIANEKRHVFATVSAVSESGVSIRIDGDSSGSAKYYTCNTDVRFSVGDRVIASKDSGTYVIICKIGSPGGPVAKTSEMSQEVGVDNTGRLWTKPASYTLPTATSSVLGGVKPEAKTTAMTQAVGVDANGKLWTAPPTTSDPQISTIYSEGNIYNTIKLNNTKAFTPSGTGFAIGSTTYPFESLYVGSSSYHWSITAKGIVPSTKMMGYFDIGSSLYPVQNIYTQSIYINGTKFEGGSDFAGKNVKLGGDSTYYINANTSRELAPNTASTTYQFYLGTSTYYWHYAYIGSNTVKIGSTKNSKLAFFAGTPIAQQTLSSSSNNMGYSTATSSNYLYILNNLVGILKNKYGLIA